MGDAKEVTCAVCKQRTSHKVFVGAILEAAMSASKQRKAKKKNTDSSRRGEELRRPALSLSIEEIVCPSRRGEVCSLTTAQSTRGIVGTRTTFPSRPGQEMTTRGTNNNDSIPPAAKRESIIRHSSGRPTNESSSHVAYCRIKQTNKIPSLLLVSERSE